MEFNQDRHFRKPAQLENGHKMVLWMGYINMHGDTQAGESGCVCVCVSWGQTERKEQEKCSLNANKKLKAYLQYVIPTAQLAFSL